MTTTTVPTAEQIADAIRIAILAEMGERRRSAVAGRGAGMARVVMTRVTDIAQRHPHLAQLPFDAFEAELADSSRHADDPAVQREFRVLRRAAHALGYSVEYRGGAHLIVAD